MATTPPQLDAFYNIPVTFMNDMVSVIVHGGLSYLDTKGEEWAISKWGDNEMMVSLLSGFFYTIRQDYGFNVLKEYPKITDKVVKPPNPAT
jgi:hypothetical protein